MAARGGRLRAGVGHDFVAGQGGANTRSLRPHELVPDPESLRRLSLGTSNALGIVEIVPATCVLWFVNEAVQRATGRAWPADVRNDLCLLWLERRAVGGAHEDWVSPNFSDFLFAFEDASRVVMLAAARILPRDASVAADPGFEEDGGDLPSRRLPFPTAPHASPVETSFDRSAALSKLQSLRASVWRRSSVGSVRKVPRQRCRPCLSASRGMCGRTGVDPVAFLLPVRLRPAVCVLYRRRRRVRCFARDAAHSPFSSASG